MKKLLFTLLGVFMTLPGWAQTFEYEHEGQTLRYVLRSHDPNTVAVSKVDKEISGHVVVPEVVEYNDEVYTVTAVEGWGFHECALLESVELPNTITNIEYYGFYGCNSLTSINLPENLVGIDAAVFEGCRSLDGVVIPESVGYIEASAFLNCQSLTSISIPNKVRRIGGGAFRDCKNLKSINLSDNLIEIEDLALDGCENLLTLDIPASVQRIGHNAFARCKLLPSIKLPSSLKAIEEYTFAYCSNLQSIEIPETVKSIGEHAFDYCTSLSSINIPSAVRTIKPYTFARCEKLESIEVPESVSIIEMSAFEGCTNLTSVKLPSQLKSIAHALFIYCNKLSSIEIPESVTSIGDYAFYDCYALSSIDIPNNVTSIGERAFQNCHSLHSIKIPDSVTKIGDYAFSGEGVKSIILGKSITELGEGNFNGATKVAYPNTLTWEGDGESFAYDPETAIITADCIMEDNGKTLAFVILPTHHADFYAESTSDFTQWNSYVESYEIPEGVTKINKRLLANTTIGTLTIPASLEVIEEDVFDGAVIGKVVFEDWDNWYENINLTSLASNPYRIYSVQLPYAGYQTLTVAPEIYSNGERIMEAQLHEGMTEIRDYVNSGLSFVDEVEIPSTVRRIGAYAFNDNKELYHVFLNEGLEEIGDYAFSGCELLENTLLPNSLKTIGNYAFRDCKALTEVEVPEGLTSLGVGAFMNCDKIEKALLVADIDKLDNQLFQNCKSLNKIFLPLNLKTIGDGAFTYCSALDQIVFPSSLESIGSAAFQGCSLTKVAIPNSVTSLGQFAFKDQQLKELTIGSGIETIPYEAFANNALVSVRFSEGLQKIETNAFINNARIGSVILPSTVTEIAQDAFANTSILDLEIPDGVTSLPAGSCGRPSILSIGSGIKSIDSKAFDFAELKTFRLKATMPPTLNSTFPLTDEQNDALTLVVNKDRAKYYQTNARWKQIDNIVEEEAMDVTVYLDGKYSLAEEIRMQSGLMPSQVSGLKVVGPLTTTDLRVLRENMVSLTRLDLSEVENVSEIPDRQFENSLLAKIVLPENLKKIGEYAFSGSHLLKMNALPETLEHIGGYAFSGCPGVTFSRIPEAVSYVGDGAFKDCIGIREMTVGSQFGKPYWDNESEKELPFELFSGCYLLERIDLGATSLVDVRACAFYDCYELDEIIFPETLRSIDENTFINTAVRDLSFLPAGVERIGYQAFSGCRRLVAATLPESVKEVEFSTFSGCPRLLAVSMPSGTVGVGQNIVNGDRKLANISCAAVDAPEAETGAFDNIRLRYVSLTVPTMSFRSYLSAPQWGKFETIKNIIPVKIDKGVEVTNVAEDEYQDMLKEDALEEQQLLAQEENEEEFVPEEEEENEEEVEEEVEENREVDEPLQGMPRKVARRVMRRVARRAEARANTSRSFAALFDGAQIQTGDEGSGMRIFINPEEGVNVTSILYDGKEMIGELKGNSLLLPAGTNGTLEIRTDAPESPNIGNGIREIDFDLPYQVYDLNGLMVGDDVKDLPAGLYILRQGAAAKKIAIN